METETLNAATATLTASLAGRATTVQTCLSIEPSPAWRAKNLGLDETWHDDVSKLALTAEAFCRRAIRNNPKRSKWLVLAGNTGCGKTHAARRIIEHFRACKLWAWQQGFWGSQIPHAAYWPWQELASLDEDEWDKVIEDIKGADTATCADLLVLDDVGAETDRYRSGVPTERFHEILELMKKRWLLITTNVPKAKWPERWNKRVSSRMEAAAHIGLFNVPDYRPKLARE